MLPAAPARNADGAYQVLAVADGWVRVLPGSPRQWRAFVELLGSPEALAGPEWEIPLFRLANADVIRLVAADGARVAHARRGARRRDAGSTCPSRR